MVGLFPKGELLDMVLLAEMKAMIGPNDDDRVPGMSSPEPFLRLHQLCCSLRQIVPIFFLEKRLVLFAEQGRFGIAYLRIVSGIDNAIGCLLNALEEQGLAVNPIIVYTADNG